MSTLYREIEALNQSGMDYLKQSPAHYRAWRDGLLDAEPTPAQIFGAAFHAAVLTPRIFKRKYARFDGDRRTKTGKQEYEELSAGGLIPLSSKDWKAIAAMRQAVFAHPAARLLLRESRHEVAKTWKDPDSGAACKGMADCWNPEKGILAELKSAADASEEAFRLAIARYHYHRQAAFYLDGFGARAVNVIAVEKAPPYGVMVYRIPPHVLAVGRAAYKPLAALYQGCVESGKWPCYDTGITDLQLPAWAIPDDLAA